MISKMAVIFGAFALLALAMHPGHVISPGPAPATVLSATATGKLTLADSLQGQPVVTASHMAPGHDAGGQVRIKNVSRGKVRLGLVRRRLTDAPGPRGGRMSSVVQLRVKRVRKKRRHRGVVYQGSVAEMPRVGLGRVGPRHSRKYHFDLRFPDGGTPSSATTGDNAYQGSTFSVDFVWLTAPSR